MNAELLEKAIEAGVALIPAGLDLINAAKELLAADDKVAIQARLDAQADQQHASADAV